MAPRSTTASKAQTQSDTDALQAFQKAWTRAEKPWLKRVTHFKQRHDAYRGIVSESDTKTLKPRGVVLPRYAYQASEVLVSNLTDDMQMGIVAPRSAGVVDAAKSMQEVLGYYRGLDSQDAKFPRHARQTVVMGMGPAKIFWRNHTEKQQRTTWATDITGSMTSSTETYECVDDRPSFEPIDVYDFLYDPSASRTDQMGYCLIRHWVTLESLKDAGIYQNLDKVAETRAGTEQDTKRTGRNHAGSVEVVEYWTRHRLITVANRTVVIQNEPQPYFHNQLPIICANTTPDLYTCDGTAVIDLLMPMQAAAWDIWNQMLRNVDIANLLMVKVRRGTRFDRQQLSNMDVGSVLDVDSTDDVEFWNAGNSILEPGMDMLKLLETTMQQISGANVYLAGGAQGTVDTKTATGISLIQSMAQKLVVAMRQVMWSEYRRKGLQEIALIQQLTPRPIEYRVLGAAQAETWKTVMPWELSGEFDFEVGDQSQSLNEQQVRAEAQQLVNLWLEGAPIMAQQGIAPNMKAVYSDALEAYGKKDIDSYFQALPPPPMPVQAPPPNPNGDLGLPTPGNSQPLQGMAPLPARPQLVGA